MKQSKLLLSAFSKAYVPIIAMLSICFAIGGSKSNVLWGIPFPQGKSELLIRPFLRWHLLTIPPLLFVCEYIGSTQALEVFIRVRIKNDKKLIRSQIFTCGLVSVLWGTIVALLGSVTDPVKPTENAILLTIMGHVMWMCLYLSLYSFMKSVSTALIATILLIASIFFVGEFFNPRCEFLLTSWSMVSRSKIYDSCGVSTCEALKNSLMVSFGLILIIHFVNWQRKGKL